MHAACDRYGQMPAATRKFTVACSLDATAASEMEALVALGWVVLYQEGGGTYARIADYDAHCPKRLIEYRGARGDYPFDPSGPHGGGPEAPRREPGGNPEPSSDAGESESPRALESQSPREAQSPRALEPRRGETRAPAPPAAQLEFPPPNRTMSLDEATGACI